jgi:hypothetical protein
MCGVGLTEVVHQPTFVAGTGLRRYGDGGNGGVQLCGQRTAADVGAHRGGEQVG